MSKTLVKPVKHKKALKSENLEWHVPFKTLEWMKFLLQITLTCNYLLLYFLDKSRLALLHGCQAFINFIPALAFLGAKFNKSIS